jgi:hypothetical protein
MVTGALVFAACSGGSLMPGTGMGGGGGSGTGVTIGTGGSAGFKSCYDSIVPATCTQGLVPPGSGGSPQTCAVEGGHCEGYSCNDSFGGYSWAKVCCSGVWWNGSACPAPVHPGAPFACGNVNCVGGESYCSYANEDRGDHASYSCKPLCAARDCSCFCDEPEGCSFAPPGSACPADVCECGLATSAMGISIPGSVGVQCHFLPAGTIGCARAASLDGQCGSESDAWICSPISAGSYCTQLPDSLAIASCGSELHAYCCLK